MDELSLTPYFVESTLEQYIISSLSADLPENETDFGYNDPLYELG